ncbi:glycosyltransferase [Pseudofrankia sp. DC12]|uniref:glycosyltransferase family 2 protein n=1 Tax=Pseudofrankia sp. DC12 TaxID=683315 RepID=UPI0005F772E2|nr:glycosyltransferase [Pseudofrankia sp. DC12]
MSTVSVVVCSHLVVRYALLAAALESLRAQTRVPDQVIVVVDGDDELLKKLHDRGGDEQVLSTGGRTGLSNARNTGLRAVTTDYVAFLDDDATAEPAWLESLVAAAASSPDVLGVGGRTLPAWESAQPGWFPDELLWTVGCSHQGLPASCQPVRNVFGGCALFRRRLFDEVGGFDDRLGRKAKGAAGCEETEFCIRAQRLHEGGQFLYEPAAVIHHRVPRQRSSPRYVLRRCWEEGRSKALLRVITRGSGRARPLRRRSSLGPEQDFLLRILPAGVFSGLRAAVRGQPAAAGRVLLLLLGSATTVVSFVGAALLSARRDGAAVPAPESPQPARP